MKSEYYRELIRLSKILLAEEAYEGVCRQLLERVIDLTQAESGFLVVREEGSYQLRYEVGREQEELSQVARRFSSSLVRETIRTGRQFYIANLVEDPRFARTESAEAIGPCSVLATPLLHEGEVFSVLYIESRARLGSFSEDSRAFLIEFAEMAAVFLQRSLERQALLERSRSLERGLLGQYDFSGIVTHDPKMIELLDTVAQVAATEATALIRGETGTGKELIARALHVNSPQRQGPFVTVHCAALPAALLEAELFGHVSGAFTGARRDRRGRLASAQDGTLFLDEIGEVPLEAQARLLRFVQFGEIQRVGSDRTERVHTRVVTATHRDLQQMVRDGSFREDLYYRLKVIELTVPPLRERKSDIPLLVEHFLKRFWRRPDETPRLSRRVELLLGRYDYPGNVRELAHLLERASVLARGPEIDVDLLPVEVSPPVNPTNQFKVDSIDPATLVDSDSLTAEGLKSARRVAVAMVEEHFVELLLQRHSGNVSQAARDSGIHRSYLHKLLLRHPQVVEK